MIFESLTLENFGAYAGHQELLLTPGSDRPVILVGGMNGGGKTTLLDALQLVLYGARARTSTRGRESYHEFLRSCINRTVDPQVGSKLTLRFKRFGEGRVLMCEVQRSWRETARGISETLIVNQEEEFDPILTEQWDDFIESYLPSRIAHLFFFDGEQIKELAERDNAAEILGTAVHSLLGLDVVDRLQSDLKVLERRKRAEVLDGKAAADFSRAQLELTNIDELQATSLSERAALENVLGRLRKGAETARERFRTAGGEAYLRRAEIEKALAAFRTDETELAEKLRDLLAGPLPLTMNLPALAEIENAARQDLHRQTAKAVCSVLEDRDQAFLCELKRQRTPADILVAASTFLAKDRAVRASTPITDGVTYPQETGLVLADARQRVLPALVTEAKSVAARLAITAEHIAKHEHLLESLPDGDAIADLQIAVNHAEAALREKQAEIEAVNLRQAALSAQRAEAERRLERFADAAVDEEQRQDSRQRILDHSVRVRRTLEAFRSRVVQRHIVRLETLILESLQRLFRKQALANRIVIDPDTYAVTLMNSVGQTIPFGRLSAGERQLLATALLWGLARASGRPVPTVIDTPLGRLDSTHRRHLVRDYFPHASHQVILLSTDEEIRGSYLDDLRPSIARTYRLAHNDAIGTTTVEEGYLDVHTATA
jgi:DNA sulfur modification protein DndD